MLLEPAQGAHLPAKTTMHFTKDTAYLRHSISSHYQKRDKINIDPMQSPINEPYFFKYSEDTTCLITYD